MNLLTNCFLLQYIIFHYQIHRVYLKEEETPTLGKIGNITCPVDLKENRPIVKSSEMVRKCSNHFESWKWTTRRWQIYRHYTRQRRPIQLHVSLLFLSPWFKVKGWGPVVFSSVYTLLSQLFLTHIHTILWPHPYLHTVSISISRSCVYSSTVFLCTVTVSDCICMLPLVGELTRVLGEWVIVSGTFGVDGTGTLIPGG